MTEYIRGRSPRESHPISGIPGYVASHDTTGNEDYRRTSPIDPLPTNDSDVLAKLSELDSKINGSYVEKSTETKPTGKNGDSLFLWDTRQVFLHDGTDWREI